MKDIWSKAPEGATHWDASPGRTGSFMKVGEDGVYFWPPTSDTPRWCHWSGEPDEHFIPRPMAWNGEGLPPVGVECEFKSVGHHDEPEFKWCIFRGKTQFGGYIIEHYQRPEAPITTADAFDPALTYFRPIRTAEQIAAEDRRAAVLEMKGHLSFSDYLEAERHCEQLYDAGYRKQVQP